MIAGRHGDRLDSCARLLGSDRPPLEVLVRRLTLEAHVFLPGPHAGPWGGHLGSGLGHTGRSGSGAL